MCATFKWCPYNFPAWRSARVQRHFIPACQHKTHTEKAEACRPNLSSGCYRKGSGGAGLLPDSICRSMHEKNKKPKTYCARPEVTKQCSAYSHPCTVALHRCCDCRCRAQCGCLECWRPPALHGIFFFFLLLQPATVSNTISAACGDVYSYCMLSQPARQAASQAVKVKPKRSMQLTVPEPEGIGSSVF